MRSVSPQRLADLGRLSGDALTLLEVAALLGRTFSIDDVAEVLGGPVGRVLPSVRETLAAGLVSPCGDLMVFRHERVRKAICTRIPHPIQLALHRQISAVLLGRGGSAVPAAAHLIEGARPGDHQTLAALDQAVRELIATSPAAAADLALRVLQLTEAKDGDRFIRTVTAVKALLAARRVGAATELARAALTSPEPRAQPTAQLRLTLSSILAVTGQPARAVAEAEAVLSERGLPDELCDAAELARLLRLLALDDFARAQAVAEAILAGGGRPAATPRSPGP